MLIREATVADIPQLHTIRMAVKENVLSNPSLVTYAAYEEYLTALGKGWVYESNGQLAGFAIISDIKHNVWALFVHPDYEKQGIGQQLNQVLLDWYFSRTSETVWLSTEPASRAESFYRKAGWISVGMYGNNEIKFEMTYAQWIKKQQ